PAGPTDVAVDKHQAIGLRGIEEPLGQLVASRADQGTPHFTADEEVDPLRMAPKGFRKQGVHEVGVQLPVNSRDADADQHQAMSPSAASAAWISSTAAAIVAGVVVAAARAAASVQVGRAIGVVSP